jgi:hypothetical protein
MGMVAGLDLAVAADEYTYPIPVPTTGALLALPPLSPDPSAQATTPTVHITFSQPGRNERR